MGSPWFYRCAGRVIRNLSSWWERHDGGVDLLLGHVLVPRDIVDMLVPACSPHDVEIAAEHDAAALVLLGHAAVYVEGE